MSKATAQSAEDPILQWVTFRLDNESYGINVMQVQEVLRYTEIAPVPGAPSYVLGIINLRGNVVTVIDTRQRFGLTLRRSATTRGSSLSRRTSRWSASWSTASPRWST